MVIIIGFLRRLFELYQLWSQRLGYFKDWITWLEWALFFTSIIFTTIFANINGCLCVLKWQWQLGIVAVFLGWIGLVGFLSKLPLIGLYVVMFHEIVKTSLKVIIFSILLVVAFALAFYMAFFEPGITVRLCKSDSHR